MVTAPIVRRISNRTRNVTANYLGVLSSLLVQVLLVPVYVRLLGTENYGIIGFFTTLQSLLQVMDLGFGVSLNRELARRSASGNDSEDTPSMVRTLELVSWSVGLSIGALVFALSTPIATRWLRADTLTPSELAHAIRLMGIAIALQWSQSIYNGGLLGLQKQARAVAITSSANFTFACLAIAVLLATPTLDAFFGVRCLVSFATVATQRAVLWREIRARSSTPACVRRTAMTPIWNFSVGMTGVALTGITLVQIDKLVISKFVTLDLYGAYMIASGAAALIPQLVAPIFTSTLPLLSQAFATDDSSAQRTHFLFATRLIVTLVHPVAVCVALFAEPLLYLWTGDRSIAAHGAPVLSLLATGALLNSLMVPFYTVQLAAGWTRLAWMTNVVLIVLMIPYAIVASRNFGARGAASTWLFLNGIYLVLGSLVTFRRMPAGTAALWFKNEVAPAICCTVALISTARVVIPTPTNRFAILFLISVLAAATVLLAAAMNNELRRTLRELLHGRPPSL